MAGERALPGLGLFGYWTIGSDGWDVGMDSNLRILSALVGRAVISATTALPVAPVQGDIYIVPANATANANDIALYDNGAWVYLTPKEGWRLYVKDTDLDVIFTGLAWKTIPFPVTAFLGLSDTPQSFVGAGGHSVKVNAAESGLEYVAPPNENPTFNAQIGTAYTLVEADFSGKQIVEMDNTAANTITVPAGLTGKGPVTVAQVGTGQTSFAAAVGVTIRSANGLKIAAQNGMATLIPRGTDIYYLTGNLVA